MTDKQIEKALEKIEQENPERFTQFKLKQHVYWSPVEPGTTKLKWGFNASFVGNLTPKVKVEVSKLMNKPVKSAPAPKETEEKETAEETTE